MVGVFPCPIKPKKDLREENRENFTKPFINNNNESASAYLDEQSQQDEISVLHNNNESTRYYNDEPIEQDNINVPYEDDIIKCVSEFENSNVVTNNWMSNIMCQSETAKILLDGKVVKGFVHDLNLINEFYLTLHMEEQLEALKKIPFERRIVNFNSTKKMVKITNQMHEFNEILTYGFIAQDMAMIGEGKYVPISETSTSNHDMYSISKMFLKLKIDFHNLFRNEKNICKFLVIDLSWISIQAAITQFNNETIDQYLERMFHFSKDPICYFQENKVCLVTCASNTIKQFCQISKKKNLFSNPESRDFSILCFWLLMNCFNLESMSQLFSFICSVFLSSKNDLNCQSARYSLGLLIEDGSEHSIEIKRVINQVYGGVNEGLHQGKGDSDDLNSRTCFLNTNKAEIPICKKYLREKSLFTAHFIDIYNQFQDLPSEYTVNRLYNPSFIDFLLNNFMPYAGIWASFGLNGIQIARFTNGIIDKFWQQKNSKISIQNLTKYINTTLKSSRDFALGVNGWYSNQSIKMEPSFQSDFETSSLDSNSGS